MKLTKKDHIIIFLGIMFCFAIISLLIMTISISNIRTQFDEKIQQYDEVKKENIILKKQISYEIEKYEIYCRMIDRKVTLLNTALAKIYPKFDYKNQIKEAENNFQKIELLPESLIEIYIHQKIVSHGLNNYQKTIPEISWPVNPNKSYITTKKSEYGTYRPYSYMKYKHEGIDIGSPFNDSILAVHDGIIHKVFYSEGGGWTIELKFKIESGKYYFTRYRHCEKIFIEEKQEVKKGDIIASIGNTGFYSLGKHLHFEIWEWTGRYYKNINPVLNSTWNNRIITSI